MNTQLIVAIPFLLGIVLSSANADDNNFQFTGCKADKIHMTLLGRSPYIGCYVLNDGKASFDEDLPENECANYCLIHNFRNIRDEGDYYHTETLPTTDDLKDRR